MDFLTAVQRVQDACSEEQASVAVGAAAGSLDEKFANFVREAYRTANAWKRWPWTKAETAVAALANPLFTIDASVEEADMVTYNGVPLVDKYTYEDLINMFATQIAGAQEGTPAYYAMKDDTTIFTYPTSTDANPEANLVVYGYVTVDDPATDGTNLVGRTSYHDAVVQLAYSIAVRKHFGDPEEAKLEEARAYSMLQRVATKARRGQARPRIRT